MHLISVPMKPKNLVSGPVTPTVKPPEFGTISFVFKVDENHGINLSPIVAETSLHTLPTPPQPPKKSLWVPQKQAFSTQSISLANDFGRADVKDSDPPGLEHNVNKYDGKVPDLSTCDAAETALNEASGRIKALRSLQSENDSEGSFDDDFSSPGSSSEESGDELDHVAVQEPSSANMLHEVVYSCFIIKF